MSKTRPSIFATTIALVLFGISLAGCGGGSSSDTSAATSTTTNNSSSSSSSLPFIDSDQDGTPDNNDAAPNDPLCWVATDASKGECFLRTLASTRLKIAGNANGKIFFSAEGDALMLYAYDLKTKHFLGRTTISGYTPTVYAYSPEHARLYVGDTNGNIYAYPETLSAGATQFGKILQSVSGLAAAGKFLLAQDGSGAWATHYIFNKNGIITQSKDWNYYSSNYEWSPTNSRIYFFRDNMSPNDLMYEVIDQGTGLISSSGETPYHGSYTISGPIRANSTGSKILLGSGDIYTAPTLTWAGKITATIKDAMWLANDELVIAHSTATGTHIQRFDTNRVLIEDSQVSGELIALSQESGNSYLILKKAENIEIQRYTPSNDTDGDGINNTSDKFPLDKAAALDSDNDGYPDSWNSGYSAADSTTGLTLDAYPKDASCHTQAQGNGVDCNSEYYSPTAAPNRVLSDGKGTVFLFTEKQTMMYRWSWAKNAFISPLIIGQKSSAGLVAPVSMAYSPDHNRLYLGYESGQITYIDLSNSFAEQNFASTSQAVRGLASAGKYVLAQDESGAWATHYIFDKAGQLTDSKDWNYYSQYYEWAPSQSRLYFFKDDTSPNDLMFQEISQTTGKINNSGESPYHGDYVIQGPIRISQGGARIILGSGDIYSTTDLTVVKSLKASLIDMQWMEDGSLVTLSNNAANSLVTTYNSGLALNKQQVVTGSPIAIIKDGNNVAAITQENGKTIITKLIL